ncbi:MAG: glycerate kinase [Tenericutes bacterium HGW-Tenericutes-6]|nr:MAG: glycerate kinase [Tenericutes bacterium HGW-Tenericutes-6]
MKKFIIIPDSFKGTISSHEVCQIIEKEIKAQFHDADIKKIPVADGGEGSVDAFLEAKPGKKIYVEAKNPYFETIKAFYGLIDQGKTAVIEMAACAGLPLVEDRKNPSKTTTYGVGELVIDAIDHGAKKIILGLGGSATNDGGAGFAQALGVVFKDIHGHPFLPTGGTLHLIKDIDIKGIDPRIKDIEFLTMCDIDNPLYGFDGAAYIFGPQKGANPEMVKMLDDNLKHYANIVHEKLGFKEHDFKGAGAAGGMGFAAKVFLNSKIQMGIEAVLDVMRFDELAQNADYIITGEGKLDSQSLRGKVVIGVARRAKKTKAKVIAVVGSMEGSIEDFKKEGVSDVVITNYENLDFESLKPRAKQDMAYTVQRYLTTLS